MNKKEHDLMVMEVVESLNNTIYDAAERNSYKDIFIKYPERLEYCKGWATYNLTPKLDEELKELRNNPSPKEIGDVAWVLAMMLDQLLSCTKEIVSDIKEFRG